MLVERCYCYILDGTGRLTFGKRGFSIFRKNQGAKTAKLSKLSLISINFNCSTVQLPSTGQQQVFRAGLRYVDPPHELTIDRYLEDFAV